MRLFILSMMLYGFCMTSASAESGVLEIDWDKLNALKSQVSARRTPYPSVLVDGVSKTKLPVFLPSSHAYDPDMFVVADENFYTISIFLNHAVLIVSGDKSYQQSLAQIMQQADPSQAKAIQQAAQSLRFIRSEGMMTTDFNRYGANYSLILECNKPNEDQRCLHDDFLQKLYRELILVGGHP